MANLQDTDLLAVGRGAATYKATFKDIKDNLPAVPDASETAKGVVELATAAETTTGTDNTRAVHPAGLKVELDKKAPLASPTFTGVPAAPTAAAGTKTTQIATTAFVDAAITAIPAQPSASEAAKGIAELATQAETTAGTDDARIVTPKKLKVELDKKVDEAPDGTADGTIQYARQVVTAGSTQTKTWVKADAGLADAPDGTAAGVVQYTRQVTTTGAGTTGDPFVQAKAWAEPSFLQTGTGAVRRSVESKLRDSVSILDFGADPTGVADSSAAIQAAVDAHPGKAIFVPKGTYLLNSTITIKVTGADTATVRIIGDGSTQAILNNQSGGAAIAVDSGTAPVFAYDLAVENIGITSVGTKAGTAGIQLDGCRFARIKNVSISKLASHGIHGHSTVGDLTDTAQITIEQCEIKDCGGYGVYAQSDTSAIQYNWNLDQVRVGQCALGGVLYESMVNARITNSGIYYNSGFGLRITAPVGGNFSKGVAIENTEFDTNDGVQVDLGRADCIRLSQVYLVANPGLSQAFTKGVFASGDTRNIIASQLQPRLNPTLTGLTVFEVAAGAADVVVRDTDYTGYGVSTGNMYVDNTVGKLLIVDDAGNRARFYKGTFTAVVGAVGDTAVSPTTATGYYSVAGNNITASVRNILNVDTTGLTPSALLTVTMPKPSTSDPVEFAGSTVISNISNPSGHPIPLMSPGSDKCIFRKASSFDHLLVSNITSSTSSIHVLTISYIID